MAQKRMFSLSVTDTDVFLDMPASSQALYFHLGMHGDDDGFVGSPKKISRAAGCNDDDLKLLAAKGFVIPFDSGVIVIRDWRINNTLKNDRYRPTIYTAEKALLSCDGSGRYALSGSTEPCWNHSGTIAESEHNATQPNVDKRSEGERAGKPPRVARFMPPTVDEVAEYCRERGNGINAQAFVDHYQANGWTRGKTKIKDWRACVRTWERAEQVEKANARNIKEQEHYVNREGSL